MLRLSGICRYRPLELAAFLAGQNNWLISEFVFMAPEQYLDGIASELTGRRYREMTGDIYLGSACCDQSSTASPGTRVMCFKFAVTRTQSPAKA